jgi:hypothetical protein
MSDHDWVALGAATDDGEYQERFQAAFGMDITPPGRPDQMTEADPARS